MRIKNKLKETYLFMKKSEMMDGIYYLQKTFKLDIKTFENDSELAAYFIGFVMDNYLPDWGVNKLLEIPYLRFIKNIKFHMHKSGLDTYSYFFSTIDEHLFQVKEKTFFDIHKILYSEPGLDICKLKKIHRTIFFYIKYCSEQKIYNIKFLLDLKFLSLCVSILCYYYKKI